MREEGRLETEVAALEGDEEDRREMLEVAAFMADLREPVPPGSAGSTSSRS